MERTITGITLAVKGKVAPMAINPWFVIIFVLVLLIFLRVFNVI